MPVAPTYPGVYIEEIPSGVHTVTGVSTSITAFLGYTARGPVDQAVHIFSFADFDRGFGGLAPDSPLSYAVRDFFQNGGSEAYVVRVARGAAPATVTMRNGGTSPVNVLEVTASSAGTWGNGLQIDVDYWTTNPASLFNLRVTEWLEQDGQRVRGREEVFRNLCMGDLSPTYVVDTVNASSDLIRVAIPLNTVTVTTGAGGTSKSRSFAPSDIVTIDANRNRLRAVIDGKGPVEIVLSPDAGPVSGGVLDRVGTDIAKKFNAAPVGVSVEHETPKTPAAAATLTIRSKSTTTASSVQILTASRADAAAVLRLGQANGETEEDGVARFRPLATGTFGPAKLPDTPDGEIAIEVFRDTATAPLDSFRVPIWGSGSSAPQPQTLDEVANQLGAALAAASDRIAVAGKPPYLAGATAQFAGGQLRILPGPGDPNISFGVADTATDKKTAGTLGLKDGPSDPGRRNVGRYAPGAGVTARAQQAGVAGSNGTPPDTPELTGSEVSKTGMFALEGVDLFNLLVIPDATAGAPMYGVLTAAIAYCTRRRAFMIIDAPEKVSTFAKAQQWLATSEASSLRSRNAAIYFPRLRQPDPLMNGVVRGFQAAGALAGLFARTDAERGVWKAPAGTAATVVGATGLSYALTDNENGTLNPLGLNCLRTFPVYGTVSWGARTGRGADVLADEYKYVPVRRLALFLEESLFRGTKWAVFEPNDEPLWAQIRLNLGAFMHTLFAQGAFQGQTPREAYFVKCDQETTTQNDRDLGRVNIVVGFAPLKPAEFVIIQIQQIAGAIQT